MEITLKRLELTNFKGQRHFVFDPNGENADVFGDNATGKTSLFDAWLWMFTGKNSEGKADFNIKDTTGKIPDGGIDHEAEAALIIDGRERTFKRTYHEVYAGKRGIDQVLKGHTTEYRIDGEGMPENKYNDVLKELFPGQIFQILTDPLHFNSRLAGADKNNPWKTRREFLFKWFGEYTDAEVIAANPDLKDFSAILDGKTVESRKSIITDLQKDAEKKAGRIPDQIAENERMKPDISGLNLEQLQAQLSTANEQLFAKQGELSRIQNGEELTKKRLELRQVSLDIQTLENNFKGEIGKLVTEKESSKTKLSTQSVQWANEITGWQRDINQNKNSTLIKETEVESLRAKYRNKDAEEFQWDESSICPTCGQNIPADELLIKKVTAQQKFNLENSQALENIQVEGKKKNDEITKLKTDNADLDLKVAGNNALIETNRAEVDGIQSEINRIKERKLDSEEYRQKATEKETIEKAISQLESGSSEVIEKLNMENNLANQTIQSINADISKFTQIKTNDARIEELDKQQKELADKIQQCEKQLYIIGLFTRRKCEMLSENINKHFKVVKWDLFEIQVNGTIIEKCEATAVGVPNSDLNFGMEINAGLDIINAVSEKLNLCLPVFIDGCESVTEPIKTRSQQIRLIVSKPDKKLRVEYRGKKIAGVA